MSSKNRVYKELKSFKRRYWIARLIQGLLIFSGTGLVLFGIIALIEYASWMSSNQRMVLFFISLAIETFLLLYYIAWPVIQILLNGNALSDWRAAQMIGKLLEDVDDRLLNFLELDSKAEKNELIDASLDQKGNSLLQYRFSKSFEFSTLKPYLLFLLPLAVMLLFVWQGNRWHMLEEGTVRLVNFNIEYERELPFIIIPLGDLIVDEGDDYTIQFKLDGSFIPEEIEILSEDGEAIVGVTNSTVTYDFKNCYDDITVRLGYDGVLSETYTITVIKKPVMGRVSVEVLPPRYTGIDKFIVQNSNKLEVPEGSEIAISYAFKNTPSIEVEVFEKGIKTDSFSILNEETLHRIVSTNQDFVAKANKRPLHALEAEVIRDKRPELSLAVDSLEEYFIININSNDDYKILSAEAIIEDLEGRKERLSLKPDGNILKRKLTFSYKEIDLINSIEIKVSDQNHAVSRRVDLARFKEPELTTEQLLENAGADIAKMRKEDEKDNEESSQKQKSKKSSEDLKKEAEQLNKTVKKLAEKDSVQFDRLEKLSEEIKDLLEKMDKDIPKSQKQMSEKKLEEKIAQLEKEWMILKVVDQLNNVQDSLKKKPFVDEERMKRLQEDAKNLEQKMDLKEKEDVDWEKFEELSKNNEQLKEKNQKDKSQQQPNADRQPQEEEEKNGEEGNQEKKDQEGTKPQNQQKQDLKEQMQEDSEQLKQQLGAMSSMMMMEAMQANIELIRRLELRSLKASKKQEEIYTETVSGEEYDKKLILAQTEIKNSASRILDSLSALTVSDPMLGNILNKNQQLLQDYLGEMTNLSEMNVGQLSSKQRYLQYSLNDLASILYDILKSESEQMQNMMAGNKACNKPKPGKGKKESLSQQQKKLGEKMGKMKKPGKGKPGRQTLSDAELLELIKGQEQILEQYQQQQNKKGGQKAGDAEVVDKMNKQLDDLVNNNIDKAIERNKEIEDKLITIEKSDNQKKEDDKKRQSRENKLDYDAIRNTALQDYLRKNQTGTGVVNLPALKTYYSGKWVIINQ
jgi:hypothetical protein